MNIFSLIMKEWCNELRHYVLLRGIIMREELLDKVISVSVTAKVDRMTREYSCESRSHMYIE
jgi:hypothetical protein